MGILHREDHFTLHRLGFCPTTKEDEIGDKECEGGIIAPKFERYETIEELKERNIVKISVKEAFNEETPDETKIFNTLSEDNDCQICFDHAIDCVIQPCGHLCMCSICGDKLKENP